MRVWLQPSLWQDSDGDEEVAQPAPKQERKREDLVVANRGGPEADQTKPAEATEVAKQERKGEDFGVANRWGPEGVPDHGQDSEDKPAEAAEVPKQERKGEDHAGHKKEATDQIHSPSSLSDITQGEAPTHDENGNEFEEPQVPPPVKRQRCDQDHAAVAIRWWCNY